MISRRTMLPMLSLAPLSRALAENISPPPTTRLLFGGDVMLSRYVGRTARDQHDPAFPLRDLAPVLAAADLAFVNLESPFSDRGRPIEAGMVFKAEPEMIDALEVAGIDIVSTANNHARDCGGYGVGYTLEWLSRHKIAVVGTAATYEDAHAGRLLLREVLPVTARGRASLALVLRPERCRAVRAGGRLAQLHERDLADLHLVVDRDREIRDIRQLEGHVAVPAGVDETGGRVDQEAEPPE